jgi:ATP-dependent RNA helicase DeaD
MERYRIAVGHDHGVMPGNIVGAIANEADIEGRHIGRINIYDDYSLIDLPKGMPKETFDALKKVWVSGQRLGISREGDKAKHKDTAKLSLPKGKGRRTNENSPKRKSRKKHRR